MGLSPVAYFICILSSNVLAAIAVWSTTKGGSVEYPSGEWRVTRVAPASPKMYLKIFCVFTFYLLYVPQNTCTRISPPYRYRAVESDD